MRIHRKVSTVLILVLACFSAASYLALAELMRPAFDSLQNDFARADMLRAERALTAEFDALRFISGDWAPWDDAYRFMGGTHAEFINDNLDGETLANLDLNLMAFLTPDRRLVWGGLIEPESSTLSTVQANWLPHWPLKRLTTHESTRSSQSGLVLAGDWPMMVSARPIVSNDYQGPIAGTLLVGRFLDTTRIETLRVGTQVELDFVLMTDLPPTLSRTLAGNDSDTETVIRHDTLFAAEAYRLLPDLSSQSGVLLKVRTPLRIAGLGASALNATAMALAAATLLVGVVLWLILRVLVVRPLGALTEHIAEIRNSGDLSPRLNLERTDEIGSLAHSFDALLAESEAARSQLLDQSYKAGVSESASAVLHNIRNTMTPLVYRAESARKSLQERSPSRVDRVLDELAEPSGTPDRNAKLLNYLRLTVDQSTALREAANRDLESIAAQARQIEDILAQQEQLTHQRPVLENLVLLEAVAQAAAVVPPQTDIAVRLDPSIEEHRVRVHRSGLLQILGNVFLNAYEAIRRANQGGLISVRADRPRDGDVVCLSIRDDGTGIAADQLGHVFDLGYTSKDSGRGGLGLHWCANTLAAMGGSICAQSDGIGHGAEFQLFLPGEPG